MKLMKLTLTALTLALALPAAFAELPSRELIVVVGAPGTEDYAKVFTEAADSWTQAAEVNKVPTTLIRNEQDQTPLKQIESHIARSIEQNTRELWMVFIGHGTFDGRTANFNLNGPDLSSQEMSRWLDGYSGQAVLIQGASASAPFLNALSGSKRIIVTATRSGSEQNYTRFSRFFAESLQDDEADLDQDGQNSVLELFLAAAHRTAEFYKSEGRLATEHPLIDDNGDGLGTPADWFRGLRVEKQTRDGGLPDGARAHQLYLIPAPEELAMTQEQREARDQLELEILRLRDRKEDFNEEEYYERLEALLLQIAEIYQAVEDQSGNDET